MQMPEVTVLQTGSFGRSIPVNHLPTGSRQFRSRNKPVCRKYKIAGLGPDNFVSKSKMMRILLLGILAFIVSAARSQPAGVHISITDSLGRPLPRVTVSLHATAANSIIKEEISDSLGTCLFSGIAPGDYFLSVTATGYQPASSAVFVITKNDTINKQVVKMSTVIKDLAGITVTAARSLVEMSEDKIIYNVDKDPALSGLSAAEALAKVPFVNVDGDGNVQLKGQSSFQILLNGKQTSMFASNTGDILKSFPADIISRIEVVTNPSAKYDGEGVTGLINIITKKKVAGYNGTARLNYNTVGQVNPNASFNFKYGKIGITSFFYYARNLGFDTHGSQQYTATGATAAFATRWSADAGRHAGYMGGGNLEVAYDIDSLQVINFYGRLSNSGKEPRQQNNITAYDQAGTLVQQSLFFSREKVNSPGGEAGLDYLKNFRKPDQSVSVNVNYQFRKNVSVLGSDQYNSMTDDRFLQNDSRSRNIQTSLQADYTMPVTTRSKLELGGRAIFRNVNSTYTSKVKDEQTGKFEPDPDNSNELQYRQNVAGIYAVYTYTIKEKKLTFKLGSRLEKTNVNGNFVSSNTRVKQDYYSLLPSFSINKTLADGKRLSLAYNRRLARPGLSFLNPFVDNRDPLFISYGNEKLKPEFAGNIDLSIGSFKKELSYSIALTGSFVNGGIQRFFVFNETTGVTRQTYDNIGKSSLYGINGYLSLILSEKLSITINANGSYGRIRNTSKSGEDKSGLFGSFSSSVVYSIAAKLDLFSTVSYSAPPVQLQGQNGDYLFYNFGGNYKLCKKKLILTLGILNPFNRYWKTNNVFESFNFRQQTDTYIPARMISVGVRFVFGKLKENTSRKKGVTIDDTKADVNSQ